MFPAVHITSHAVQVLGCVLLNVVYKGGESEGIKYFTCVALKACTAFTAQETAPELITTHSKTI